MFVPPPDSLTAFQFVLPVVADISRNLLCALEFIIDYINKPRGISPIAGATQRHIFLG
jgi:hypothetical protein